MSDPDESVSGPVVVGFDGTASGEDALTLARACARVLGSTLVVATVHPGPPPVSLARVDAEWVAARHRQAEEILDAARRLVADVRPVEFHRRREPALRGQHGRPAAGGQPGAGGRRTRRHAGP
jgi:nucleotide-binding universal stress UspA family protein